MQYQLASALLLTLAGQASARAIHSKRVSGTISTSFTDKSTGGDLGATNVQTVINAGVQVWLSGRGYHLLSGNIQNSGSLIVSQTDSDTYSYAIPVAPSGQTVYWAGSTTSNGNLINNAGASILLNDVAATSAPTYDWYLESFQNDGTIQWCGRGDTGGSTYQLYSKKSGVNNGLVVFEQTRGNLGTAAVWRNDAIVTGQPPATLTNNGGFLMRSMRVDFVQNFLGNGCWMIGNAATMYLQDGVGVFQNPTGGPSLSGQSISFLDNTGVLHMDTAVYSQAPNFGATIYGFGQGNKLEFYETISTWSYSGSTLRVTFVGGNSVNLNIGSAYASAGFSRAFGPAFNYITYTFVAPSTSRPAQCLLTAPVCAALVPGQGPAPPASSSIVAPTTSAAAITTSAKPASSAAPATSSSAAAPTSSAAAPATSAAAPTTSAAAPTTSKAAPSTSVPAGPVTSPLGCFQDSAQFGGPRTLNGASYVDTTGLTNQACAAFCTSKGFPVSGTEYGEECFCGSSLPTTGPATCDKPCSGDKSQICGGSWALTVLVNPSLPLAPVSSSAAPTTSAAAPTTSAAPITSAAAPTTSAKPTTSAAPSTTSSTAPAYTPYKYDGKPVGCFADAAETGAPRTLSGASYKDGRTLTNENCANFCGDNGFAYSGTEYGEECYCGNTLPTVTSTQCNVACSGNATETCGGSWTLTVTVNQAIIDKRNNGTPPQPPYNPLGCFLDSVAARTFTGFSYTNDTMTPAQCAAKCSSLQFAFSGTEFGNECYCSKSAPVTTSTQCNKPCAGNSALICGGPDALTVYQDTTIPVVVAPPTCPGLPAGYAVCAEGQRVSGGKCVNV